MSISFRLSEKAKDNLQNYGKQKKLNRNKALNHLLENLESEQPQLEQSQEGKFLELPPFLRCQDTETDTWLPREECLERCKTCNIKRFCEAWQPRGDT